MLERLSIELTNQCGKHCSFCYNHSHPSGETRWDLDELVNFVTDCAQAGTRAVSFGGGEPLEYLELDLLLERLRGVVFRSFTTNGLLLDDDWLDRLAIAAPDKVHISIHFPESHAEVKRAIAQANIISWDKRVGWCFHKASRCELPKISAIALINLNHVHYGIIVTTLLFSKLIVTPGPPSSHL